MGEALRAVRVRVDDPDVVRRFGIRQYYEIEVVTPDSQNNPLVVCVAELPEGLPLGDKIHESVRVAGFFLKSWAYNTAKGAVANMTRNLAIDHAPEGVFVRRWIPEFGTAACPRPIVDERAPSARAQQRPAALRATPEAHAEADAVQQRHGSRKSGLPPSGMHRRKSTANPTQGERF